MEWLLDPAVTHLNHGGYGARPRVVVDAWQGWQRELERSPTDLLSRRLPDLLDGVRAAIAKLVGVQPSDLTLVPNATSGLNAVIRSLRLGPGDEVLTTAAEYGALLKTWAFVDATLVVAEPEAIPAAIGARTKVVFLSHITSETARVLSVLEACAAARVAGLLTVVDGAYVPGHLPLDLEQRGADVYAGNCHKWLCAPKGAAFLWARPEHHGWIEPVVTSWGWGPGSALAQKHEWQGIDGEPGPRMWATELVPDDPAALGKVFFERHRIEAPVHEWGGRRLLRVSIGPYNDDADIDRLVVALRTEGALRGNEKAPGT